MKKLFLVLLVILLAGAIIFGGCAKPTPAPAPTPAPTPTQVTFELISGIPKTDPIMQIHVAPWIEKVNQQAGGRLTIKYSGGPEAVPPMEQIGPLSQNVYQLVFAPGAYAADRVPSAVADVFEFSPAEARNSGFTKVFDEMFQKSINVKVLDITKEAGFRIYLNKRIDRCDLTGLRLRVTPGYVPMVKALGGVTTYMPLPEMFPALQQGVIDGLAGPPPATIIQMKVYEVVKYIVSPGFGNASVTLFANLAAWNKLPKDLQDIVLKNLYEANDKYYEEQIKKVKDDMVFLKQHGVEEIVLPPGEAEKLLNAFYAESYASIVKNDPTWGPKLKEANDKIRH